MSDLPKSEELIQIGHKPPLTDWMDTPTTIRKGMYCYAGNPKSLETLSFPNARKWNPLEDDWQLPENWKEIIFAGLRERLDKFRSFKVFMDICVRCGACADKCHFFIGTGDPKNMPVLRAELLRSVYRNDFTAAGKILGKIGGKKLIGAREMTLDVLKLLSPLPRFPINLQPVADNDDDVFVIAHFPLFANIQSVSVISELRL